MAWIVGPLTIHRQVGGASCVGLGGGSPTILMGGLGGSKRAMQGGCPTILRMPLVPDPMPNKKAGLPFSHLHYQSSLPHHPLALSHRQAPSTISGCKGLDGRG